MGTSQTLRVSVAFNPYNSPQRQIMIILIFQKRKRKAQQVQELAQEYPALKRDKPGLEPLFVHPMQSFNQYLSGAHYGADAGTLA